MKLLTVLLLIFLSAIGRMVYAEIQVVDDIGQVIKLKQSASRIISLAPHTTELIFDAGAGDRIIGTVSFSDYPEAAKKIQRIGSYDKFDLETIVSLQPDLIVAWETGNNMQRIRQVMTLGVPVFVNEPRSFEDIARSIETLGRLVGREAVAGQRAQAFRLELEKLRQQVKAGRPVRVFYQVWDDPLYTVNDKHLISKVIRLCQGENIFAELDVLSPQISMESVLERNPEVIVAGIGEGREDWLQKWQKWQGLDAVQQGHVRGINADLIVRHTPRILQGAKQMCNILDQVRRQDQLDGVPAEQMLKHSGD